VEERLKEFELLQYSEFFARGGYRQLYDLLALKSEKDVRALGVTKDADVRRALTMVDSVEQYYQKVAHDMDSKYMDEDPDVRAWLQKRGLDDFIEHFEKHRIDFEVLGDLTFDDMKEIGIVEVGPRRKIFRAISVWREERERKKAEAIRTKMEMDSRMDMSAGGPSEADIAQRLSHMKGSMS
jgi:hypothetical protein